MSPTLVDKMGEGSLPCYHEQLKEYVSRIIISNRSSRSSSSSSSRSKGYVKDSLEAADGVSRHNLSDQMQDSVA
jgi:hypothetical protein